MLKPLRLLTAASLIAIPSGASANSQFATVEAAYQSDGSIFMSSLYATAGQEPVDGDYVFEGYVLHTTEGVSVPWTVRVPAELDVPDIASVQAISQERIVPRHSYTFESGGASVEKTFFDVRGDEARGTLAVTDDPLPIIAWLVIGGSVTVLGTVGIYMFGCEKIETKVTVGLNSTITHETSCTKKM
ncbi:hypothetical protein [Shinella sp. BYT-45]|uniref:hypothetical protein n=1 Tax=Shinella sp. BYT-45 TaxID=3377377 RepID=UPI00397F1FEE